MEGTSDTGGSVGPGGSSHHQQGEPAVPAEALAGDGSPVPLRRQERGVRGSGEAQPPLVSCTAPRAVTLCRQPTEQGPGGWKIHQASEA